MKCFTVAFTMTFQIGEVVFGPGGLQVFGLTSTQNEDRSVTIHADDKVQSLAPFPLSCTRR